MNWAKNLLFFFLVFKIFKSLLMFFLKKAGSKAVKTSHFFTL